MFRVIKAAMLVFGLVHCTCKKAASDCKGPVVKDCMCTMDYTPVCGCDGKIYSNACMAKCAGVKTWTAGECK